MPRRHTQQQRIAHSQAAIAAGRVPHVAVSYGE